MAGFNPEVRLTSGECVCRLSFPLVTTTFCTFASESCLLNGKPPRTFRTLLRLDVHHPAVMSKISCDLFPALLRQLNLWHGFIPCHPQ